jgi:hypothetical protein
VRRVLVSGAATLVAAAVLTAAALLWNGRGPDPVTPPPIMPTAGGAARYRGDAGVPGNHRGVLMRAGRAVLMYVDFGQRTAPARVSDVDSHVAHAREIAAKLGTPPWR